MNLPPRAPFLLPFEGVAPVLHGPLARADAGSAILGRVTLGAGATLGPFATIRGDGHVVVAGRDLHLGERSTVHIAHGRYGTMLGDGVTVGSHSVVHACTVGDGCVIEDQVSVLDGSVVGAGSVVAAGSVVFPRSVLPAGHWCEGVPAVPRRPIGAAELSALHERIRGASAHAARSSPAELGHRWAGKATGYVAATVTGQGELRMAEGSSLWFGCVVDAPRHGVDLGAGANVQDNSLLRCSERAITIGRDCIVGHNVRLHDCRLGERVLVGMGSVLAPGTVVGDDTLVAAGSTTTAGQVLEGGWLWGGRPARRLLPLDEGKRQMIKESADVYRAYAREFAAGQDASSVARA
ncbi:MAG: gamma carbonic anhydrase family protein [Rubrivivax sp.]|nr:gamma carbonic anhydrase family protein [Rubrivivax sp.]